MKIRSNCPICNDHIVRDCELESMIISEDPQEIMWDLKDKKCNKRFTLQISLKAILMEREDWDNRKDFKIEDTVNILKSEKI
jgi:hypothetical protein